MSGNPLTGPCEGCHSPDGVLAAVFSNSPAEYQCKACTRRLALYTAAYDHLELLMREAVRAWLPMWDDLPGVIDLGEQLRQVGSILEGEYKAGAFDREDVQPVQPHLNAAD